MADAKVIAAFVTGVVGILAGGFGYYKAIAVEQEKGKTELEKSRVALIDEALKGASGVDIQVRMCMLIKTNAVDIGSDMKRQCDQMFGDNSDGGLTIGTVPGSPSAKPATAMDTLRELSPRLCTPGLQSECACCDGRKGYQACESRGDRWGECVCDVCHVDAGPAIAHNPIAPTTSTTIVHPPPSGPVIAPVPELDLAVGETSGPISVPKVPNATTVRYTITLVTLLPCSRSACNPPTGPGSNCWCNSPASANMTVTVDKEPYSVGYSNETPNGWIGTTNFQYVRRFSFATKPVHNGSEVTIRLDMTAYVGQPKIHLNGSITAVAID